MFWERSLSGLEDASALSSKLLGNDRFWPRIGGGESGREDRSSDGEIGLLSADDVSVMEGAREMGVWRVMLKSSSSSSSIS